MERYNNINTNTMARVKNNIQYRDITNSTIPGKHSADKGAQLEPWQYTLSTPSSGHNPSPNWRSLNAPGTPMKHEGAKG